MTGLLPLESEIKIGEHDQVTWHGMTFNMDTIYSTIVAGALVLILGFWVRHQMKKTTEDHVPTKLQILWEAVVGEVNKQVSDNLGKVHPFVAPLAIALFFFILIANWLELIPTELNHDTHLLPAPTADTNLTYALATVTMVSVWAYGIRSKGTRGYFKHFTEPFPVLLPLNILEELIKPITLALRLFGNIFAGGIMLALIGMIPIYAFWAPNILWKAFDMVIGAIQAFIFALLTVLYFAMAGAGHEEHELHEEFQEEERRKKAEAEAAHADEAAPVPAH
ncbi:MAG: F0F1 ATP synthase subunit A [Nocardioides sp.]|nr:F0F1 ATP synthase subunit A [Nocardioidaceae bacterium]MCB8955653.1 F0F1 ATP synthase subunit A [Nocardioides sp.]